MSWRIGSRIFAALATPALVVFGVTLAANAGQTAPKLLYCVVDADGTIVPQQSSGCVGSATLGPGDYEVYFNADIAGGAYAATIGLPGSVGSSPSGEITVVGRTGSTNGLFLKTYDSVGGPAARAFHVHVAFTP